MIRRVLGLEDAETDFCVRRELDRLDSPRDAARHEEARAVRARPEAGREVAIKVLPEHFADDADRLSRFEREAKALASLNHPNVAQIFGVDRIEIACFLVLELVPGESLEDRLKREPLSVEEALDVCRQITEGLEAARARDFHSLARRRLD